MNQNERELFIYDKNGNPDDYLPLVSAWKNDDGSITLIPNCTLRPGAKFRMYPKRPNAPEQAPSFQCSVRRSRVGIEQGLVEVLTFAGSDNENYNEREA